MKHPTTKDIESKIRVTIFTNGIDSEKLRYKIFHWAGYNSVKVYWITCFLISGEGLEGSHVYFEDETDAMAFKLAWL